MSTAEVTQPQQQEKPQPVKITTEQPTWTLVDALHTYVQNRPDQVVYFGIDMKGKEAKKYTSKQLLSRAEGVARGLLKHGVGLDDRVLLVFFPGTLDVCIAYFACVLVGAIPVCVFPPDPRRLKHEIPTFERSANDCGAKVVLTNTEYYRLAFRPLTGAKWPANITWVKVNDYKLENKKSTEPFPNLPKSNLAFIQYTSGSTSDPKGCMVSQANLLHNLTAITVAYTWNKGYRIASWLPHFHDMGLIGSLLVPVLQEGSAVVMSPLMFLSSPPLWIRLVSKYKCTHASTPNFGLVLAVRKSTPKDREGLDLSNVYFNCGAEPVRVSVVNNFIEMYKPYGFKPENMLISYGMAEHVLYITTSPYRDTWLTLDKNDFEQDKIRIVPREQASERTMTVSSCGFPSPTFDVKIVDPEKFVPLGEDLIGEVWLNSPSKVLGYWNHPELDGPVFNAKMEGSDAGYLRTGDYGFFHNGELYLCGRKKDLIIIGGRNYYPQDIELAVEGCDPNIRPGCVITFEVELDENELQSIVVVCEVREAKKMRQEDFEKVTSAIYRTVLAAFQLACHQVILIDIHTLMKTTSGKVQRQPTKKKWLAGDLKSVYTKQFATPKRDPVVEATNMEEETDPSTEKNPEEEESKTTEQEETKA